MIIAHQGQDAAVLRGAGQIGVTEYATEPAFAAQFGLLRAPYCSRGQIFIDTALEADIALVEECCGALKLAVETAERRTAISGDETRRIEPVAAVEFLLHQAEAHQCLKAGHENAALAKVVLVVQLDVAQRHYANLPRRQFAPVRPILPEGHEIE